MEYRADLPASGGTATLVPVSPSQRRHHRQKIHNLAYINLDHGNGGVIRNLSQGGIALQAVSPLRENQEVHLRFELLDPRARIEATGRVAWADSAGQAGLEITGLPLRSHRQLKDWLFTQLLADAYQASNREHVFFHHQRGEDATQLVFSAAPHLPIRIEEEPTVAADDDPPAAVNLFWLPVSVSPENLSTLVDGLIVMSAALLFCVMSLAMTHISPTWPLALALACGITGVFGAVYWFLFEFWMGFTPGRHLTDLACNRPRTESPNEKYDRPRFR